MARKLKPDDLNPRAAATSSDSETVDRQHSSSSDDEQEEPQQSTEYRSQGSKEEEGEDEEDSVEKPSSHASPSPSKSVSDSDSDIAKSIEPKKPTSKSAERKKPTSKSAERKKTTSKFDKLPSKLTKGGKRPAETEQIDKVSKNKKSKMSSKDGQSVENLDKDLKSKMINEDAVNGEVEEKRFAVNRVWSDKDVIVVLQGIIDYKSKNGADPNLDMGAFHEFVKDSLSFIVTKRQLSEKIRTLKIKFQNHVGKVKNGEDPVFSRPHDCKCYELWKKIWGDSVNDLSKGKSSKKKDKKYVNVVSNRPANSTETEYFWSLYPLLCKSLESEASTFFTMAKDSKEHVKDIMNRLEKKKARELEEGWKNFCVMKYEVYAKRVELIRKQTEAVLDVINLKNDSGSR